MPFTQIFLHSPRIQIARQLLANDVDRAVVKLSTGLTDKELDNLRAAH